MKNMFSSIVVLLAMLVVSQTASAIPSLATEADFSVLNTPSVTNEYTGSRWHATEYTGSRWHATFRSIRDVVEKYNAGNAIIDTPLRRVDHSLDIDTITVTTATNHDDFYAIDDSRFEKDRVDVPEPSLVALIALGLVGFGFFSKKKN